MLIYIKEKGVIKVLVWGLTVEDVLGNRTMDFSTEFTTFPKYFTVLSCILSGNYIFRETYSGEEILVVDLDENMLDIEL